MGKKNQKKSGSPKSLTSWRDCRTFGYTQQRTYPSRPEALGFPPVFREIEFLYYNEKPEEILVPQDLIGLTMEVVWYNSITDRMYRRNPFQALSASVTKASILDRNAKDTALVRRANSSRNNWRLEFELFEHIEPSSVYGEWARIHDEESIGEKTNTLTIDFCFNRIPEGQEGEGFASLAMKKGMPCAPGSIMVQDIVTSKGVHDLSSLQLDSSVFLFYALKAGIAGLGVKSFPFLKLRSSTLSYLSKLSREEEAALIELRKIFEESKNLRFEIDSLILSCDSCSKPWAQYKKQCKLLKTKSNNLIELEGTQQDLAQRIELLIAEIKNCVASKKVTIRCNSQERFKELHQESVDKQVQLESLKQEQLALSRRVALISSEIDVIRTNNWKLEIKLEIALITTRIADLEKKEVEIMAILDSLFVDRIRLTAGQYAYQCTYR